VNKHLLHDLVDLGLWNETMKQELMRNNGSVQDLDIPQDLKTCTNSLGNVDERYYRYVTSSWLFCRSIAIIELVYAKCKLFKIDINAFYAWQSGLKTGMYYLRTKAAVDAIKFTLNNDKKRTNRSDVKTSSPVAPVAVERR
jgi:ribonucleoside-diphosphate reductase alpha chain